MPLLMLWMGCGGHQHGQAEHLEWRHHYRGSGGAAQPVYDCRTYRLASLHGKQEMDFPILPPVKKNSGCAHLMLEVCKSPAN